MDKNNRISLDFFFADVVVGAESHRFADGSYPFSIGMNEISHIEAFGWMIELKSPMIDSWN